MSYTVAKVIAGTLLAFSGLALAQHSPQHAPSPPAPVLAPQGVYAHIDTKMGQEALRLLSEGNAQQRQSVLERVRAMPGQFQPPVLYVLSQTLFKEGHPEEAAFWFYAGQLRGRFDANRCTDPTAAHVLDVMNKNYGAPIHRYLFQDLNKARTLIAKVVEWDRKTPHSYDPHWINLHGMKAVQASQDLPFASKVTRESLSLPASQWNELAEQTRTKYLKGFQDAITQLQAQTQKN